MVVSFGRQLDHVAVGIAKVDRLDEHVIDDSACVDSTRPRLLHHGRELALLDLERDVKIVVMLFFELEATVGGFEESDVRAVPKFVERVQRVRWAAGLRLLDEKSSCKRQPE